MRVSKRLALAISGAAFAGTAALTLGAAAPASAAVSAPATSQSLGSQFFWGGCGGFGGCGCCCDDFFFDGFDDCD